MTDRKKKKGELHPEGHTASKRAWYCKNEIWNYIFLAALSLFFCWLFIGRFSGLGAKTDWLNQHCVFPEYFRQQFYETGKLFPEFAPNIGAGQNIYNFSYYGFLSPVVLVSYLFPWVSMEQYLVGASVLGLAASVLLFYRWLRGRSFSRSISFFCALIFLLAGPMIYHAFKQIMFVNYMPFLCLAFLGVDRYFEKQKPGLFLIGVFLMIMTSFYFSVGGILVLVLYGVYRYVQMKGEKDEKITLKDFFKDGILFLLPVFSAVLMSGILLVPTALSLTGREGSLEGSSLSLAGLFLPVVKSELFFYGNYGLGLTTMGLTVLFTGILQGFRKKQASYIRAQERILFWGLGILLFVPFFSCILNGGLYVRAKAMIPFLPLICYCFAWYAEKMKKKELSFWRAIIPYGMTILCLFFMRAEIRNKLFSDSLGMEACYALLGEAVLLLILFVFYWKWRKESLLLAPSVLLLFFLTLALSCQQDGTYTLKGQLTDRELYAEITADEIKEKIKEVSEGEEGFYRMEQQGGAAKNLININRTWSGRQYISSLYSSTYHEEYRKFRSQVFQMEEPYRNFLMQSVSVHPIFQKVMGVKYVLQDTKKGQKLVENTWAAPVFYGSSRIIAKEEYEKLPFPYNQTAFAEYAVVKKGKRDSIPVGQDFLEHLQNEISDAFFELPESNEKKAEIKKTEESWSVKTKEGCTVKASFGTADAQEEDFAGKLAADGAGASTQERILFLRFHVHNKNKDKDLRISVNNMQNKQSAANHIYRNEKEWFVYGVSVEPGTETVDVKLGPGEYEITDVECYLGLSCDGWTDLYESDFQTDWNQTKGNVISGNITMEQDGYLVSSVPYEEAFTIFVDGKEVEKEKVNTAFLGCILLKGEHQVKIVYHAPGGFVGKVLSIAGVLLALVLIFRQRLHSFIKYAIVHMNVNNSGLKEF